MPEGNNTGGRKPRVSDSDLLDVFRDTTDPVLSTGEVADAVPIKRRGVLNRLRGLEDAGELESKQIGGRNTVWWVGAESDTPNMSDGLPSGPGDVTRDTVGEDAARADAEGTTPKPPGDPPADTHGAESERTPGMIDLGTLSFDRDLTDARRSHLEAWLRHAAGVGGVSKSDFEDWWTDDRHGETGYNAGSFWEAFAKAAMKQSDQFTKPNTRTYRYTGEVEK